jgi:hypothetical protein
VNAVKEKTYDMKASEWVLLAIGGILFVLVVTGELKPLIDRVQNSIYKQPSLPLPQFDPRTGQVETRIRQIDYGLPQLDPHTGFVRNQTFA